MRIPKRPRSRGGFTLVELMIVVALIGVMSAIAVPQFYTYQARSRRGEGFSNLAGIARSFIAYGAEKGSYPDMATLEGEPTLPKPGDYMMPAPSTVKMPWDAKTSAFFDRVGFKVEGSVFYSYDVNSDTGCSCVLCFTATAHGDVDGDGNMSALMYVRPQRDGTGAILDACPDSLFGYGPPMSLYDEVAVQASTDPY